MPDDQPANDAKAQKRERRKRRWRRVRRVFGVGLLLLIIAGVVGRLYLNTWVVWYVNRVIDQNKLYEGHVKTIDIDLYKGQYSIYGIKLLKRTGNVAAPFFECDRLDLKVDWQALLKRHIKATAYVEKPQINVTQESNDADSQTGAGTGAGPWLGILRDLSPFDINSAEVHDGSLHFLAPDRVPIVDVYLDQLDVHVKNLSNVSDRLTPLNATVDLTGRAMQSGKLELHVKFDPLSYQPTFELALRLLRLDVTETNAFTEAYGAFNFESGTFDLVVELQSTEGQLVGYIKPLFRRLSIVGPRDFRGGNILNGFWQALLGVAELPLSNLSRAQFGTQIPVTGTFDAPKPELLPTVFNVLRNAFVRAYLPRLEGNAVDSQDIHFGPGTVLDEGNVSGDGD